MFRMPIVKINFESSPGVSIRRIDVGPQFLETLKDRFMDQETLVVESRIYKVLALKIGHRDENGDRSVDCLVQDLGPEYVDSWDC